MTNFTGDATMPIAGDYIGVYRVEAQIGAGGMATVYRAYHEKLDRYVAIKILHQSMQQDPAFRARFEREARIVARLEHTNIVTIYDFSEYEGQPYLVMKCIEGRNLKDVLRERRLTMDEIIALTGRVADALSYAHSKGILHRDIKPSNIIIDAQGEPYITDFGLARMVQAGESTMSADVMLGTPQYISPEQAKGGTDIDARTDVYSLGVVLYEMITGQVPYKGDTPYSIVHDHIYTPPTPPRDIDPSISPEVEAVLMKALAKQPEARFATPTQMIDALRDATYTDDAPANDDLNLAELGTEIADFLSEFGNVGREIGDEIRKEFGKEEQRRREAAFAKPQKTPKPKSASRDANLTPEERLRRRVEKRVKKRREEFFGLLTHLFWFLVINFWLFNLGGWIDYVMSGEGIFPGGTSWITLFWGIGMVSHIFSYWNDHGPGARRQEAIIQREYERELERLYGKRKNEQIIESPFYEDDERRIRLTDDGEFTDSYIEEQDRKRKNK